MISVHPLSGKGLWVLRENHRQRDVLGWSTGWSLWLWGQSLLRWARAPGSLCCTRSLGCAWLCSRLPGCSAACLCVLFPLHDHKSSSQTALTPMAANTSTYTCVYVLCPGGAGEAERKLQGPVVGHCSAGKRLIQG